MANPETPDLAWESYKRIVAHDAPPFALELLKASFYAGMVANYAMWVKGATIPDEKEADRFMVTMTRQLDTFVDSKRQQANLHRSRN